MSKEVYCRLMTTASLGLIVAGIIFLVLAMIGYEKAWILPAALVCNLLSVLMQIIYRQWKKQNQRK